MTACPNSVAGTAFPFCVHRTSRCKASQGTRPMNEFRPPSPYELRRLPGLFRRWELAQVVEAGEDYRIEDAGSTSDGTTLFAIYRSVSDAPAAKGTGAAR